MKPRKREAIEWMNKRLGTGSLWGIYEQGLKSGGGCKEGEREGEGKKEGEGEEGTKGAYAIHHFDRIVG